MFFSKYLKTEIERHRPAIGSCLGAFSSTFPIAYLEPHLNKHNPFSLLNRIAEHSLEAQGTSFIFSSASAKPYTVEHSASALVIQYTPYFLDIMARMESAMPTLDTVLSEVDHFVDSEKGYVEMPHIIDVALPLLCSYLPFWWAQGPDNVSLTTGFVV
jgi:ryanodine receptor 2